MINKNIDLGTLLISFFSMTNNTDYTFNIVQTHKNRLDYFQVVSALTILKLKIIIGLFSTKNWYKQ